MSGVVDLRFLVGVRGSSEPIGAANDVSGWGLLVVPIHATRYVGLHAPFSKLLYCVAGQCRILLSLL